VFGGAGILRTDYGKPPYGPHIEDITVGHLLTHICGGWPNDATDPMISNSQMSHQQLIAWTLANRPLNNPPGGAYAYSNFGYCLLGRIIEKVTRQSYADYVRSGVLRRCGVTQMRIAGNTLAQRALGEVVYDGQDGDAPYGLNVTRMDAHGGWIASASDLVLLATHVDDFSNTPDILQPATIKAMTTPSSVNRNYAKGWNTNGQNWWHTGSLAGTSTIVVRTASGLCWAGLANSRRKAPGSVVGLDRLMWQMVRAVKSWSA
jgi:CubicO group peptidase (beta-lactamase class C family)